MLALIFATIAALTFVVGMFVVARHYEVSVTILAQDSDIIRPLLEGRAVPTGVTDRVGMARQIVYSRKVLTEIIDIGGWEEDGSLSPVQKDRLMEEIRGRTIVTSPRADIVQISYRSEEHTSELQSLMRNSYSHPLSLPDALPISPHRTATSSGRCSRAARSRPA